MEPALRPKALLAGAAPPDLSLTSVPPTPDSETLAAFAREIQVVQTKFDQPKRSSLIIPTFQAAEKRRGSVSFDKKGAQVVGSPLLLSQSGESSESEGEEEE